MKKEDIVEIALAVSGIIESMNDLTLWGLFCILIILVVSFYGWYKVSEAKSNKTFTKKEIKVIASKKRKKRKRKKSVFEIIENYS